MVTKRARLWLTRGLTIAIVAAAALLGLATWIQSGTIAGDWLDQVRADHGSAVVVAISANEITLGEGDDPARPGVWGLDVGEGRALVGPVIAKSSGSVRRSLIDLSGSVLPGDRGRFDAAVWGDDAAIAEFGLEERAIAGPEGDLEAWFGPGDDDTWVIVVHGRGFGRSQALRLVPAIRSAGYPLLIPRFEATGDDPAEPWRHGYGRDEWRLLDAALDHALGAGGRDVVVVGFGSGASIVGTHLYESRRAERVIAAVLDAPVLSLGDVVDAAWEPNDIPGFIAGWAKALAAFRYGVDWGALDHVDRAADWQPPVLILHGRADESVPLMISEEFALARPDSVRLITFPGAGSDAAWNSDPERYEAALGGFLADIAAGPSDFEPTDG